MTAACLPVCQLLLDDSGIHPGLFQQDQKRV
jgi:hypothetical protein